MLCFNSTKRHPFHLYCSRAIPGIGNKTKVLFFKNVSMAEIIYEITRVQELCAKIVEEDQIYIPYHK